jgi:hypothetical protein
MNAIAMMTPSKDNMYLFMVSGFRWLSQEFCGNRTYWSSPNRRKRESPLPVPERFSLAASLSTPPRL